MTCEPDTSSLALGGASLPTSSTDTVPCGPLSGIPTPAPSYVPASLASMSSRETSETWTSDHWLRSMRCVADFLARTSQQPGTASASPASAAACIEKSCGQLTIFDLPGCSWKTAPESAPRAGMSSSATSWRSDIPGATESLARLMSEPHTSAIGGGALPVAMTWPTPTVWVQGETVESWFRRKAKNKAKGYNGNGQGTPLDMAVVLEPMGLWPTPQASDSTGGRISKELGGKRPSGAKRSITLATAIHHRVWPTPAATDHKTPYRGEALEAQQAIRSKPLRDAISAPVGGKLSPMWVEWLMGWPLGHTATGPVESKPSATGKSRSRRQSRGVSSEGR